MFYVYRFIDITNTIIYIGKTKDIATRMYQHKTSKKPFWKEWYKIEYVEFENEAEQSLYEILMINKYNPKYNVKDKFEANLPIDDMKSNCWKIYDEIRLYSKEELQAMCDEYKDMKYSRRGCYKRSLYDKVRFSRDEEEKSIRLENYKNFMCLCEQIDNNRDCYMAMYEDDNLEINESYHNGIGFSTLADDPKKSKTLYIRNVNNEFQISGCGTLVLTKEQLKIFVNTIIDKYELDKIA